MILRYIWPNKGILKEGSGVIIPYPLLLQKTLWQNFYSGKLSIRSWLYLSLQNCLILPLVLINCIPIICCITDSSVTCMTSPIFFLIYNHLLYHHWLGLSVQMCKISRRGSITSKSLWVSEQLWLLKLILHRKLFCID